MSRIAPSIGISTCLHAALVALLWWIRPAPPAAFEQVGNRHFTLLTPVRAPDTFAAPRRTVRAKQLRVAPPSPLPPELAPAVRRAFNAPVSRAAPAKLVAAPLPPDLEIPRPEPFAVSATLPALAPPPFKTSNLSPVAMAPTSLSSSAIVHTGNFSGAALARPDAAPAQSGTQIESGFQNVSAGRSRLPAATQIAGAGFGEAAYGRPVSTPSRRADSAGPATASLEILFKPRPEYTAEARRLQIEGEVLVQARFTAAGEVHVLRVLRGLGHGLDEAAVQAASAIRFRPASRNGVPVDSTTAVHIVFQLAY